MGEYPITETSTMSKNDEPFVTVELRDIAALHRNWLWFMVLGTLVVILGTVALASHAALVVGWLLLLAGVVDVVGAFWSRRWSGFSPHVLSGLLSSTAGVLFLRAPADAALALTLLLSCLLMTAGIFKLVTAGTYQFEACGWPLLSGIIDMTLGVMIWPASSASGLGVIGLFVGISLFFRGSNWIGLGVALRAYTRESVCARGMSHAGAVFRPPGVPSPTGLFIP
jgi:uncharacterized membrane protein HdeD (DUF308 family)